MGRKKNLRTYALTHLRAQFIQRCLRLALQAYGQTSPNPMVGAAIVKNGKIIAEGYHKKAGQAHLFKAMYKEKVLSAWIVFILDGVLYYPYGASSREHRELMANNLLAWEVIMFGKKKGCKKFDMWGSLGENPDKNDPWYGFHKFKEGYGGELVEFVGSWDLVVRPVLYWLYRLGEEIRWMFLRWKI